MMMTMSNTSGLSHHHPSSADGAEAVDNQDPPSRQEVSVFCNRDVQEEQPEQSEISLDSTAFSNSEEDEESFPCSSGVDIEYASSLAATTSNAAAAVVVSYSQGNVPTGVCVAATAETSAEFSSVSELDEEEARKPSWCSQNVILWCPALFLVVLLVSTAILVTAFLLNREKTEELHASTSSSSSESTSPPTSISTMDAESGLFFFLRDILKDYVDPIKFLDLASPQSRALAWLVTEEQANPLTDASFIDKVADGHTSRLLQRFALLVLALSCGGDRWADVTPWMNQGGLHECEWEFVTCDLETRMVTKIELNDRDLTGSLPGDELGLLTHLTHLDVASNRLQGLFPAKTLFSELSNLKNLDVSKNELVMTIPTEIGLLSNSLEYLRLGPNLATGTLPSEFILLQKLRYLNLESLKIRGQFSDFIPFLSSLEHLIVAFTDFRGDLLSFEDAYGHRVRNLTALDIRGLTDVSNIPTTVGYMSNLRYLRMGQSIDLSGTLPTELALCTKLKSIGFEFGGLQGTIPSELGRLTSLWTFSVVDNRLHGTVPAELGEMRELHTILLAGNRLTGTLPEDFGRLSDLTYVQVFGNIDLSVPEVLCLPDIEFKTDCHQCTCCGPCLGTD